MSNRRQWLVGIHIEGQPGADRTATDGIAYYFDTGQAPNASTSYDWTPGLVTLPRTSSSKIDPFTGEWNVSSFSFELTATDAIATELLVSTVEGIATLTADITASTTTLSTQAGALTVDQVYYIEDETILVTASLGAGDYTVQRQRYGSPEQAHVAGDAIFDGPPYWTPREIELITHDTADGTEQIRWRGYIDEISTSRDGSRVVVRCSEVYRRQRNARVNVDPIDLNTSPGNFRRLADGTITGGSIVTPGTVDTSGDYLAAQLGDALIVGQYTAVGSIEVVSFAVEPESIDVRLGSTLPRPESGAPEIVTEPVWEVLCWDRIGDANSPRDVSPISGTDDFHPLRIALELLDNTDLPDRWSLGLDTVDATTFADEISDTIELQIDRLVLGLNGEAVRPFEVAERLIRAAGYIPSITQDGQYSIRKVRTLTLDDQQGAEDGDGVSPFRDGPLQHLSPLSSGASEVTAVVGELPWQEPARVSIRSTAGTKRTRLITDRERIEYLLPFYRPGRADQIAQQLADSAQLATYKLPRIRVRVADYVATGVDYDLGDYIALADLGTLEAAWFVDKDRQRITDLSGRSDAIGMLVSRELDLASMTYTLELLLLAYVSQTFSRERAPSGYVESVDGTLTVVLVNDTFTADDAPYFTSGDQVEVWSRDGVLQSSASETIDNVAAGELTLANTFATNWAYTPVEGDIIRVASASAFVNAARYSATDRPYVYLADANGEINRPGSAVAADIYGGALGVSY